MIRSRGLSLFELMLALVVVAIGISVLLAFSSSNQRQTANKATGNDNSVIVNQVLEQFIHANASCSNENTACDLLENTNLQLAGDYLSREPNTTLSDTQKTAINTTGIQVTITSCPSDVEYPTGCPTS